MPYDYFSDILFSTFSFMQSSLPQHTPSFHLRNKSKTICFRIIQRILDNSKGKTEITDPSFNKTVSRLEM